jgi:methanogenic corrinoid protein MtbC1
MLDVAGFEIHDLGRNVPLVDFVEKAKEVNAQLICLSTLMTTTMDGMSTVIELLKEEGIRDRFKVLVGGGPISKAFADRIGADGYADNAANAVRVAKELSAQAVAA